MFLTLHPAVPKTATGKKYSIINPLNDWYFLEISLDAERDIDKEIETEERTSDELDLKYRRNLFQIEGFMTNDSFSEESVEDNSKDICPSTSSAGFVKLSMANQKIAIHL